MKLQNPLIFSILSGLLLSLSFPEIGGLTALIFLGLVPLLNLVHKESKNNFRYFFLAFLLFNGICGFWVFNATSGGGIAAAVVNALLMASGFQVYVFAKKHLTQKLAYLSLISTWLAFEYFHMNWDLTWSWFNLGNTFANNVRWIQWYEYTGVQGGTLWVLLVNILIHEIIVRKQFGYKWLNLLPRITAVLLLLIVPILLSNKLFNNYNEPIEKAEFVVVQPNYESYDEKFVIPEQQQIFTMRELALQKVTDSTSFVLFPETAIPRNFWIKDIATHQSLISFKTILNDYPKTAVVTGAGLYKEYNSLIKPTVSAHKLTDTTFYDSYNSAIYITKNNEFQIYHKSKLVPGAERQPFTKFFSFFDEYMIPLGGIMSVGMGTQSERDVFTNGKVKLAPIICYESIYGEHVNGFVQKGANVLSVITNDGWWKDTPGYKQHWDFAKIRAIETRRSVARSANTGISGFINQRGEELQKSKWDERTVLSQSLSLNNELTFYVKHGNYLYRIACFVAVVLFLFSFVRSKKRL